MSTTYMSDPPVALVSQSEALGSERDWHHSVLNDIGSRLGGPGFPCIFARNAFAKGLVRFVFVENLGPDGIRHLADGLQQYVTLSRDWNGRLDTAYPLIVAFAPDAVRAESVDGYHALGWQAMQELHELDPAPWPTDIPPDPHDSAWSMCFDGMPLFCNISTPENRVRRSRNLGSQLVIVINPRERFDTFGGDTPNGRRTRAKIRGRIEAYDGVPHARQLGSYGTGAPEWAQYGLIEENRERDDRCPFVFRGH